MFNRDAFSNQTSELQNFEYFLLKIYQEFAKSSNGYLNDLSVLKCQKLLFFTVAINTQSQSNRSFLGNNLFTDFKAYQYGPVEETIYEILKGQDNKLSHTSLTFQKMELNTPNLSANDLLTEIHNSGLLSTQAMEAISNSIRDLVKKNPFLIKYSPFNLVDLSHRWRCWSFAYERGARSVISMREIENESMTFAL